MRLRSLALLPLLALMLVGAGSAAARPVAAKLTGVKVVAKDFSFTLSRKIVPHGRVTFVIKNDSQSRHDFAIAGHRSKTIGPGKTTTLTVTLKRGRYPYRCTVDSHAELGMKGVLRVS
jgi:plastocyanin